MEAPQEFSFVEARFDRRLLSLSETAELMDYSPGHVRNLRSLGALKTEQFGKRVFFWRDSVEAYMKSVHNPEISARGWATKLKLKLVPGD